MQNISDNSKRQMMLEAARQETWIKTPFSFFKTGRKLTPLQQDVLLMVSAHMQQYVRQFFDLKLYNCQADPLPLFARHLLEQGIPPFRIYFADMGICTTHYKTVREAIDEMNLVVEIGEVGDNGKQTGTTVFVPVFSCFRVPQLGGKYVKKDEQGEVIVSSDRYAGYVDVEINNKVAQYSFNMIHGYVTHPLPIARYATKRSTTPLYFLLQHKMGKSKSATVYCTVQELKDFLGFETYKDQQTGEWVVPYAKFAHFKTKILDVVQRDLEDMAKANHSDITFTYQPIYRNGRKRGDPDSIEFQIVSTGLGIGYNLMTGIDSPAVRVAKEHEAKARQLELFAEQEAEEKQRKWKDAWEECRQELIDKATNDDSRRRLQGVLFHCFEEQKNRLVLRTTSDTYEWLESPAVIGHLASAIKRHFPTKPSLGYRITSS